MSETLQCMGHLPSSSFPESYSWSTFKSKIGKSDPVPFFLASPLLSLLGFAIGFQSLP